MTAPIGAPGGRPADDESALAKGLGVQLASSGRLRASPDFDVLAWLAARWQRPTGTPQEEPGPEGRARFSLGDLGAALYGRRELGGDDRENVRQALLRLNSTTLTVRVAGTRLASRAAPIKELTSTFDALDSRAFAAVGALRGATYEAQLADWLQAAIIANPALLDFATLRRLNGVAKRVWIFLEAEDWSKINPRVIGLGAPAMRVLGVGGYSRLRDARKRLAAACEQVESVDDSYQLHVRKINLGWQLVAERRSRADVRAIRAERRQVRERLRAAGFGGAARM